jgi:hypothetical protein
MTVFIVTACRAVPANNGDLFILFDRSHGEGHAGEPWAIDDDEPIPYPENPWNGNPWTGTLADLAYRLYLTGRYRVETLPPGGRLSWLESENSQDLSLYDLLVLCEPGDLLTAGEVSAVRSFLESGCSLLIVGGTDEEREGVESRVDLLNGIIDQVLEVEGGVRFRAIASPENSVINTKISLDDPITRGPFGEISRVSWKRGLRLTSGDSTGFLLTGPEVDNGGVLYLVAPAGRGKVAVLLDSHLMTPGDTVAEIVQNIELTLNLIAYLAGDTSRRYLDTELSFVATPEIRLVTDRGVTIAFETNRSTWSVVELNSTPSAPHIFRDLDQDHLLRIDGLDHDRVYEATLYCFDSWGNGPLLSRSMEFRTLPRTRIEYGDVVISEVFWGGEDQYVELHNALDIPIDLRGWVMMNRNARHPLNGLVESGGYYLLSRRARGGDSGTIEVYGNESKFLLDPTGDFLLLQDEDGNVISTANLAGESWLAGGEGQNEASMERVVLNGPDEPGNWETALVRDSAFQGTPGMPNSRKSVRIFDPLFNGGVLEESIRLSWENQFGDSVTGVNLYRSEIHDSDPRPPSIEYVRINTAPISPEAGEFMDTDIQPDISYQYILGAVYPGGEELFSEPIRIRATIVNLPANLEVDMTQNYPNPFNPQTEIKYSIDDQEIGEISFPLKVVISIFNVRGQRVRILEDREVAPGDYTVRWDGRNDIGEPVSSGSYYYRLMIIKPGTGEILLQLSKKMVLLR